MPLFRARFFIPLLAVFTLLTACATKQPVKVGARYIVTVPKTALYKYGPAQTFGPDLTLTQGTIVTMLESTFGFCHVMTENGVSGYVSSDDIKVAPPAPATPKPVPLAGNSRAPQFSSARPKPSNIRPTPGGPLFDVSDLPMPLPDTAPLNAPKPKFRY